MTNAKMVAPIVLGVLMLVLWEGVVSAAAIPSYILPGPILVAKTLVADWGTLEPSLLVTVRITLEALAAAVVVGGLLAILFSLSRSPVGLILQASGQDAVQAGQRLDRRLARASPRKPKSQKGRRPSGGIEQDRA